MYSVATQNRFGHLTEEDTDSRPVVDVDGSTVNLTQTRHRYPRQHKSKIVTCPVSSDGPLVSAIVHGRVLKVFLDSGAKINIVKPSALRDIESKHPTILKQSHIPFLSGISGNKVKVQGEIDLPLKFNDVTLSITCLVVDIIHFPGDILLGLYTMIDENIALFPHRWNISIKDHVIPLCSMYRQGHEFNLQSDYVNFVDTRLASVGLSDHCRGSIPEKTGTRLKHSSCTVVKENEYRDFLEGDALTDSRCLARLAASISEVSGSMATDTVLHPHSLTRIRVKVQGVPELSDVIAESETCKVNGTFVEPSWHTVQDGTVSLFIANTSNADIHLQSGTHVVDFAHYSLPVRVVDDVSMDHTVCTLTPGEQGSQPEVQAQHLSPTDFPDSVAQLLKILNKNRAVVALPGEKLGLTPLITHKIPLEQGTTPIYVPAYRLPHSQRAEADRLVEEMLQSDVIESSNSPWNAPLILVPKRDGTWRPVIDYRKLNRVTIPDRFPLPVLNDLLQSIGRNKVFSTLDLLQGFWQIPLDEESKQLTAFSTPNGHFHFKRMPFGLRSSPITFSRLMTNLFRRLIGSTLLVYLDDLIIMSQDVQTHFQNLEKVLAKLAEANLKIKLAKCSFLKQKINFLGHTVTPSGITLNESKIIAARDFPTPRTAEAVRQFTGLVGFYRSFIAGFSIIAAPLYKLQRKDEPFVWGEAQDQSFKKLKAALISSPVLRYPDFSKPFTLVTDASDIGLGAALLQTEGHRDHAIAYASRTLSKEEKNYSATEREALAVVWALKHFKDTIYNYPVHVLTDHQPLIPLFKNKNPVGKFARYLLTIQEFNPTFGYIPGKQNVVADAFSRHVAAIQLNYPALDATVVETEQRQDPIWAPVIKFLTKQDTRPIHKPPVPLKELVMLDNLLCRVVKLGTAPRKCCQLVVPAVLVPTVLKIIHDAPASAHPGKDRTLQQGRLKYFWPKMAKEIAHYVDRCLTCLQHKGHVSGPNPIQVYPATKAPWERISMDLLTNFAETEKGNKHLLVMVDNFSRFCELVPIPNKTAETIASAFHDQIICRYSMPKEILSDNGPEFSNSILTRLCNLYNIKNAVLCHITQEVMG